MSEAEFNMKFELHFRTVWVNQPHKKQIDEENTPTSLPESTKYCSGNGKFVNPESDWVGVSA